MTQIKITVEDVRIAATVTSKEDRPTPDRIVAVVKKVAQQRAEVEKQIGK